MLILSPLSATPPEGETDFREKHINMPSLETMHDDENYHILTKELGRSVGGKLFFIILDFAKE